ncbi:ribonuclease BN (tRNA processing enzyme) [Inhella inkyongensis]|uniref:Ribonuclease BN (tRNA processing enzyme) n=1 Tax=Inhella inkyongensis TaxID=392593 RepID=A0A840S084_9BURK|nr:3',5'-cyclic-nucleotide phosphodiesterase [Inhella inkyongensis]MBB5202778.1 ribonuclease BN (tRNA processing enzyme) [Inhella inkyongensis]
MTLRVLGCSGAIAAGCKTTSFLLDQRILIDAGTGVGDLSLDELAQIDHVLLSHSHLDHVLSLPLLADAALRRRRALGLGPVQVHALPETLLALKTHLFNDVIWPDFTRLPSAESPALGFSPLETGQVLELAGRQIEVLPAAHTVPACGFAIRHLHGAQWLAYTGDTGPNPALWRRLNQLPLRQLIIEAAFGDDEAVLAALSRHHCPASLMPELRQLQVRPEIWLTHIKPGETQAVLAQLAAQPGGHAIRALQTGQLLPLE